MFGAIQCRISLAVRSPTFSTPWGVQGSDGVAITLRGLPHADPHRVVFIDETSVKTNMTWLRGRSPYGTRLASAAPFGAWGTQTFIAGLTHDPKFNSWSKTELWQVVDVEPMLVFEKFYND